ncbi:MAG: fused MFS/spermidine synthase [Candidatus Sumerlaeaceae bacterium]
MSSSESPIRRPGVGTLIVLVIIFLGTGASGLIYQVVWQRYLLNIFGATLYSVSTVLSAFMGGLALGSWLFGSRAAKFRRHLKVYAVLEILIGVSALLIPLFLKFLDPLFVHAYRNFGSAFYLYSGVRFLYIFLILLIPTTLMGATLPVLSQFVSPTGALGPGLRVGLLYTVNTLGAMLGAFLSGFYFIRWWGVSSTVYVAAGINVAAGILALLLSRNFGVLGTLEGDKIITNTEKVRRAKVPKLVGAPAAPAPVAWIYIAYFISGLVALGLEVTWSRALVFTFDALKNTTYAFTAMLTTFLAGLALGSAAITPFANRLRHPFRTFAMLQILVGLLSVFSFFLLYYLAYNIGENWIRQFDNHPGQIRWNAAVTLVFLRTAFVLFIPTFCMGLAFPVAVRAVTIGAGEVGSRIGRLYSLNTIGAIIGAAATGFLLLPSLGIAKTILLLSFLQMLTGVALTLRDPDSSIARRTVWSVLALLTALIGWVRLPRPAIFQEMTTTERMVQYKEGPLATVSVLENSIGYRTIYVDNVGVAGTEPMLLTDQKSLAHVPMLFLKKPRNALTVGFGSGGASYSYTLYPELEHIDCVEITRTVPQVAPYLKDSNRGVIDNLALKDPLAVEYAPRLTTSSSERKTYPIWENETSGRWVKSDPRFQLILDDARSYLRFTDRRYDVIATDCTDLRYKSNANLYDREYFLLTRDRITEDGIVVVWMPLAGLSSEAMKVALRTFYAVFPNMEVFFMNNQPTHYVLLIGTKAPLEVDVATMEQRLARPEVAADLGEVQLANSQKILSCFVTGRKRMQEYLGKDSQVLNTEDFPYLEFESPRYGYGDDPLLDNLDELMAYRELPDRLVAEPGKHAEFLAGLKKYESAVQDILNAHRQYRQMHILESAKTYIAALRKNPDDQSVQHLLTFDELRRKANAEGQTYPARLWSRYMLGQVFALQKKESEAVTELTAFIKSPLPENPVDAARIQQYARRALNTLADIYLRRGDMEKAGNFRHQAAMMPDQPQLIEAP